MVYGKASSIIFVKVQREFLAIWKSSIVLVWKFLSVKFYVKHKAIDHGIQYSKGRNNINGLEGLWSFAKEQLLKYHGIDNQYYPFYLKELEFRYNYSKANIYELMVKNYFGTDFYQ